MLGWILREHFSKNSVKPRPEVGRKRCEIVTAPLFSPIPRSRSQTGVVPIAYRRPLLRSIRTDRMTFGLPRPRIADFQATAEQTAWLHSAFPWHVPREDHSIPLETKYPMNHHSASTPVSSPRVTAARPLTERAIACRATAARDAERVRRFHAGDESTFLEIRTGHREKIFGRTVSLRHKRGDSEEIAEDTVIRAHRWARHISRPLLARDVAVDGFPSTAPRWPASSVRPTPTRRVATAKPRSPSRRADHSPGSGRS